MPERTQELEVAREALRQSEQLLAVEVEAAQRLQQVATQLITAQGTRALYEQILDTTQSLLHADFASIQMFCPDRGTAGELLLLGQRGFSAEAAKRWEWVNPSTRTTCGEALRTDRRIVVPDVRTCDFMAGSEDLGGYLTEGIRAAQTTPLISRSAALLGMVTTYWREPHELSASELRSLDVLARLAADLIERSRVEEALRENRQRLASIYDTVRDVIFQVAVEPEEQFRFVSVNAAFLRVTGLSREMVVGKTVNEVIPEPSLTIVLSKYRQAIEEKTTMLWEETSDYPYGRLTGEVCVVPVFDDEGTCTHLVGSVHDITERTRAEAARRESEERFRNMADTAPVMIWVSGPDKRGTFFNKAWLDFAGRTMEQECGEGWISGVHPDDLDHCLGTCGASFDARRAFQIEFRLRRADGEYRWILDTGVPRYRHGEFIGFIGSCVDLTERRLIEERLRARETQLTDAQRLAKVGSSEVDVKGGRVYWSDEMFRIVGLPKDAQPEFSSFLSHVHPKDREIVLKARDRAASSTAPVQAEFRIIRPDGEVRFVRSVVEAIKDERGALVGFRGATQDITEQVNATERLRESEKRLSNAERIAHVGNWRWDIATQRIYGSEELHRILGYTQDSTPSYENLIQLVVPGDRERVAQWVRDRLAGKGESSLEFQIARPDGEPRTVASVIEVTLDDRGLPAQVSGTCQDVTDVRRAQAESFARQKLESLGTLASGIAHDFNNLLGVVGAQAELALAELAGGSSPEGELKAIRDAAMRGSEIVRELMVYAGKESEVLGLVDVSQVVEEMLELLKISSSKHATLKTDYGQHLPTVRASAAQISQLVMNLATNASEAIGDRDGVIRITTRRVMVGHGSLEIERLAEGQYIQLEVSDTGCGMSPETQARVLDPFFSTKSPGRGLGLAVVHGIVNSLGGAIKLASAPGHGTTFQILLPCAETTSGSIRRPVSNIAPPARMSRMSTVLIVEDEDLLRQAVSKMLRRQGFSVVEARDGSAALDAIREQNIPIHVLFLDITLPGASSQEVLKEARRLRPEMRVVVTSAYTKEMAGAALQGTIEHFIRKPYRLDNLVQLIRPTPPEPLSVTHVYS